MDIKKLQEHLSYIWDKKNDKSKKKLYRLCGINAKWGSGKSFFIVMQILELTKETNCKVLLIKGLTCSPCTIAMQCIGCQKLQSRFSLHYS